MVWGLNLNLSFSTHNLPHYFSRFCSVTYIYNITYFSILVKYLCTNVSIFQSAKALDDFADGIRVRKYSLTHFSASNFPLYKHCFIDK